MISPSLHSLLAIDVPPLLAALLSAVVCGLLGNWLVLRRMSLMGDAMSHAVLPGIVTAFIVTGSRAPLPMFLGALIAGGATALFSSLVRRHARVDSGAAMGVVFTSMFALGVLLIEQASARQVDLDPDCVLYGSLETLFWFPPSTWHELLQMSTFAAIPTPIKTLVCVTAAAAVVTRLLRKELALASFDPELATSLGFRAGWLHGVLMLLVAAATVASFEAVGSILVVAMLICPAATARMWTDRLRTQIRLSVVFACIAAIGGYLAAVTAPHWLGTSHALNAAGSISVMAGVVLGLSAFLSPAHGIVAQWWRRRALAQRVTREDVLALLFRLWERGIETADEQLLRASLGATAVRDGIRDALRAGEIARDGPRYRLAGRGLEHARSIVRSHRLWESYLVEEVGLSADHVHATAEQLEHVREALPSPPHRESDPHGRAVP
ncbi:MAG: metal ABC transporter permease [Phycisphaerae bacterium]|nr:metal ABC transporter permease [Phycisphaerae bacterium]